MQENKKTRKLNVDLVFLGLKITVCGIFGETWYHHQSWCISFLSIVKHAAFAFGKPAPNVNLLFGHGIHS